MFRFMIRDMLSPQFTLAVVGGSIIGSVLAGVVCAVYLILSEPKHQVGDVIQSNGQQAGMFLVGVAAVGGAVGALVGVVKGLVTNSHA
ncbi:MAG TPA: hypothetical protein VGI40_09895 [Pirellulaceae bacterium]|jgi:hypothetical protein